MRCVSHIVVRNKFSCEWLCACHCVKILWLLLHETLTPRLNYIPHVTNDTLSNLLQLTADCIKNLNIAQLSHVAY